MSFPQTNHTNLHQPTSTSELDPAERFIVWSFRRWVQGLRQNTADHWNFVWNEFARQLGSEDGHNALSGFAGMVKTMQCNARRRICYHQPCCPYLGADEVSIVCFVAACQRGHLQLARSHAEWLIKSEGMEEMIEAGSRLANGMRQHGLVFPERCSMAPKLPPKVDVPLTAAMFH